MNGPGVKVPQLYYARAVAELGSFSRAAETLGVSQPALSTGVASLERVLGAPLFVRTTRGATPSAFGERLLPYVEQVLAAVERLDLEAKAAAGHADEPLRLGLSPLIHPRLVARAFEAARHHSPTELVLREDNLAGLHDGLRQRSLDVVLVPSVGETSGLARREIDAEPLSYLGAAQSSGAGSPTVELADLRGDAQLLVAGGCGLTMLVEALFDHGDLPLERSQGKAHSYRNLIDWAHLGLGGAILPASRAEDSALPVRTLVDGGEPVLIHYEAQWVESTRRTPLIHALLDAMTDPDTP